MVNYLNGLRKDIGLLINFGPTGVEVKRKYRARKVEDEKINHVNPVNPACPVKSTFLFNWGLNKT